MLMLSCPSMDKMMTLNRGALAENSLPRVCAPPGLVGAKLRTPGANQKKKDDDIKPIKFRSVIEVENVETLILVVYIISET
jgi:hypothetical protein